MKKQEVPQELFDLYDDYAHNKIDRRGFLEQLSAYAVGGLTVAGLLDMLLPKYAENQQISNDDPRLYADFIHYDSPQGGGRIKGLQAYPKERKGALPAIVVVHENRGLNPYIEDVARQAALAGFLVLAPDALSPLGGYPGNDDDGRALQRQRSREEMLEDFIAAHHYLQTHPLSNGRVGVVGFCFGGWIANMMAVQLPELGAAVPFYGGQPTTEEAASVQAPLLLHFAELDTRVNEGWPAYEEALKVAKKDYTAHFYPAVNHGFHNNSTPRYDEAAASLAWERTLAFFREHLK